MIGEVTDEAPLAMFLVERYWPDVTAARLDEAVDSVTRAADQLSRAGRSVRHLQSVLAVPEEVVFSLFEAPSAEAVDQVHRRSGVPFERIVEALVVAGPPRPTRTSERSGGSE